MISCELLSNVLKKSIYSTREIDNHIEYEYENGMPLMNQGSINIYELMHLMKEWALLKGYKINSYLHKHQLDSEMFGTAILICNKTGATLRIRTSETEPEAIFKAGEWILKEIR